ncbi:MAG: purine/pyrimidine permease [Firmicutes bacterium]|nr:purine/pyrimidine permease [Bacillota bacterium]
MKDSARRPPRAAAGSWRAALWTGLYAGQWLAFTLASLMAVPVAVGQAIGLDPAGIAGFARRTFLVAGAASLLQLAWGHGFPLLEGPAGIWWATMIGLGQIFPALGHPLRELRADLEGGVLAAGLLLLGLGASGLFSRLLPLFTPAVTGSFLLLVSLQLAGPFLRGLLGLAPAGAPPGAPAGLFHPVAALAGLGTVALTVLVSLRARGSLRSLGVLAGVAGGWLFWLAAGRTGLLPAAALTPPPAPGSTAPGALLLPWGRPALDAGVTLTSLLVGLFVTANLVASLTGIGLVTGRAPTRPLANRTVLWTGVGTLLGGLAGSMGTVPFTTSVGFVAVSGVTDRLPFALHAAALLLLALLPGFGAALSALPAPVAYGALLAANAQMVAAGVREYARLALGARDGFVIGLSLILGVGVTQIPASYWRPLPPMARFLVGNATVVGLAVALLLEHVLLPARTAAARPEAGTGEPPAAGAGPGAAPEGDTAPGPPAGA